jgi:hypothetical protein
MTGLDLESFLLLLRADLSAWLVLAVLTLGLALLVWLCWGSRRALRKCLVLSMVAHVGLVLYGSTVPAVHFAVRGDRREAAGRSHIRQIRVAPLVESARSSGPDGPARASGSNSGSKPSGVATQRLELADTPLTLADACFKSTGPRW